jgi:hypothetical protein
LCKIELGFYILVSYWSWSLQENSGNRNRQVWKNYHNGLETSHASKTLDECAPRFITTNMYQICIKYVSNIFGILFCHHSLDIVRWRFEHKSHYFLIKIILSDRQGWNAMKIMFLRYHKNCGFSETMSLM